MILEFNNLVEVIVRPDPPDAKIVCAYRPGNVVEFNHDLEWANQRVKEHSASVVDEAALTAEQRANLIQHTADIAESIRSQRVIVITTEQA